MGPLFHCMGTLLHVLVQNEVLQQQLELYKTVYTASVTVASTWYF